MLSVQIYRVIKTHYVFPPSIYWPLWFQLSLSLTTRKKASVSIRPSLASCRYRVFQQRLVSGQLNLNRAIIPQRIYLLGLSCWQWCFQVATVILTENSIWGACYCLSQGIIWYYCGYYGFHSYPDSCIRLSESCPQKHRSHKGSEHRE